MKKDISKGVAIICLYVHDLLITRTNEGYITEFKRDLMKEFEMSNLSLMTYFLGIKYLKYKKGLLIHQRR